MTQADNNSWLGAVQRRFFNFYFCGWDFFHSLALSFHLALPSPMACARNLHSFECNRSSGCAQRVRSYLFAFFHWWKWKSKSAATAHQLTCTLKACAMRFILFIITICCYFCVATRRYCSFSLRFYFLNSLDVFQMFVCALEVLHQSIMRNDFQQVLALQKQQPQQQQQHRQNTQLLCVCAWHDGMSVKWPLSFLRCNNNSTSISISKFGFWVPPHCVRRHHQCNISFLFCVQFQKWNKNAQIKIITNQIWRGQDKLARSTKKLFYNRFGCSIVWRRFGNNSKLIEVWNELTKARCHRLELRATEGRVGVS